MPKTPKSSVQSWFPKNLGIKRWCHLIHAQKLGPNNYLPFLKDPKNLEAPVLLFTSDLGGDQPVAVAGLPFLPFSPRRRQREAEGKPSRLPRTTVAGPLSFARQRHDHGLPTEAQLRGVGVKAWLRCDSGCA